MAGIAAEDDADGAGDGGDASAVGAPELGFFVHATKINPNAQSRLVNAI
ncbi:MAG: hypothetical protein ABIP39_00455 [Polyangiaceae bacterium]